MMSRPFKGSMSYNPFLGLLLGAILKILGFFKVNNYKRYFSRFLDQKILPFRSKNLALFRVYQCAIVPKPLKVAVLNVITHFRMKIY